MSLHQSVAPYLGVVAASANVGAVHLRRRMVKTDADVRRVLGDGAQDIRCCFISRVDDSVGAKREEADGNEYAVTRRPVYEFELWIGYLDEGTDEIQDSETAVEDAYERLVEAFDAASVRTALVETYNAVIVEPLAMTDRDISVVHTGHTVSRCVARMTLEGMA